MVATKTTVHDVINELRVASSKSEQGTKFEQLMVDYFRLDPTLQVEYDEVQGWSSWPHRQNSHDTGIDLVARNRDSGEWTAIQCKFYDPKYYLQKSDIDSFFTASGKSWDGTPRRHSSTTATPPERHPRRRAPLHARLPVRAGVADRPLPGENRQGL